MGFGATATSAVSQPLRSLALPHRSLARTRSATIALALIVRTSAQSWNSFRSGGPESSVEGVEYVDQGACRDVNENGYSYVRWTDLDDHADGGWATELDLCARAGVQAAGASEAIVGVALDSGHWCNIYVNDNSEASLNAGWTQDASAVIGADPGEAHAEFDGEGEVEGGGGTANTLCYRVDSAIVPTTTVTTTTTTSTTLTTTTTTTTTITATTTTITTTTSATTTTTTMTTTTTTTTTITTTTTTSTTPMATAITSTTAGEYEAVETPVVQGQLEMTVADPAAFAADPDVSHALQDSIGEMAGVPAENVEVSIEVVNRRLTGGVRRRLQGGVRVDYTIAVEDATAAQSLSTEMAQIEPDAMVTVIDNNFVRSGVEVDVSNIAVTVSAAATTQTRYMRRDDVSAGSTPVSATSTAESTAAVATIAETTAAVQSVAMNWITPAPITMAPAGLTQASTTATTTTTSTTAPRRRRDATTLSPEDWARWHAEENAAVRRAPVSAVLLACLGAALAASRCA